MHVILETMPGSEKNPRPHRVGNPPIQLLVNYWEMRPTAMGERLDALMRKGVTEVSTFVPWQAVEADISHLLTRFLQAAGDRKLGVTLVLSPEVGVHYPNSGIPRDIFSKPENTAVHAKGSPAIVNLPPNCFSLPSLLSPEFIKRYHGFLSRMDHFLGDLSRKGAPGILNRVSLVLTGSFWKYYRAPQHSSLSAFGGSAGDYSSAAAVAYRQRTELFFSQREFQEPSPTTAQRWRSRPMEEVNRRWFNQQAEDVFRVRSGQFVRRKTLGVRVRDVELFTPEADPGFSYSHFLQNLASGRGDFARLSALVDEASCRMSQVDGTSAAPYLHWTGLGGFRSLPVAEKQFLILKSLLLMGTQGGVQGGGILIDEEEWFSLSQGFRARAEALARSIGSGDLTLKKRVTYLTSHLWSDASPLWDELQARLISQAGQLGQVRMVASLDLLVADREADLLFVDPQYLLTQESITKILNWAKGGRVVALPRSTLYTEAARRELERTCVSLQHMDINLGLPYRLFPFGEGKLVIYETPTAGAGAEAQNSWRSFVSAVLSVAGVQASCSVSDGRLRTVALENQNGGIGLFILNGTGRAVSADIMFPSEVVISDLASLLVRESDDGASVPANRFALEIPPCGVLPLAIRGNEITQDRERRLAQGEAEQLHKAIASAAELQLGELQASENPWI